MYIHVQIVEVGGTGGALTMIYLCLVWVSHHNVYYQIEVM